MNRQQRRAQARQKGRGETHDAVLAKQCIGKATDEPAPADPGGEPDELGD